MADCKLTQDFLITDCNDLGIGGVSGDIYFINYDEYLTAAITRDADNTISAIALANVGDEAFKYELTRGASVPTTPLTVNNGGKSGWLHTVLTFIPVKTQAIKTEFAKLANFGRVVAIVLLDGEEVANVYGNDMGLSLTAYEEAPNDPGKGGGLQLTLSTPADVTLENLPPVTFFDTDRATTIAALDALLDPVT